MSPLHRVMNLEGFNVHHTKKEKHWRYIRWKCILCNTGKSDLTNTKRMLCGQFNTIVSVLGRGLHNVDSVLLLKTYCLPTLTYRLQNAA